MNFITQLLTNANLLRLNLQMMNNKQVQFEEPNAEVSVLEQQQQFNSYLSALSQVASQQTPAVVQSKSKKIKRSNECGHPDKEHYAKGMCNNCYHKIGRTKKPWNCTHEKLYACGLCQNCYINKYNQKRRSDTKMENE